MAAAAAKSSVNRKSNQKMSWRIWRHQYHGGNEMKGGISSESCAAAKSAAGNIGENAWRRQ